MINSPKEEQKPNKPVGLTMSVLKSVLSVLIKMDIHELYQNARYHQEIETFKAGNSSTAFVTHAL
jgi:hypothetical protein